MSAFTSEIQHLLNEIEQSAKAGSRDLIAYAAARRQTIAQAVTANAPDRNAVVRQELLNIKAYAATEAVQQADVVDARILQGILMSFSAFDTLLLASLS
jgi:hypothetical protein